MGKTDLRENEGRYKWEVKMGVVGQEGFYSRHSSNCCIGDRARQSFALADKRTQHLGSKRGPLAEYTCNFYLFPIFKIHKHDIQYRKREITRRDSMKEPRIIELCLIRDTNFAVTRHPRSSSFLATAHPLTYKLTPDPTMRFALFSRRTAHSFPNSTAP